ncbi:MAG: phosphoribosylformimino-5-aminoimidazole carboxamide ribotide isomerase [Lachnospiraceae bacterium]|nr:phosphoribosylformimino-5-aminoimidazole carboxamide ribotide isomerase [Lachnospiraceae bacterium]
MQFRPCIDIHNGAVKQIVGATLKDQGDSANENFVSTNEADYYARLYKEHDLKGGHVILLNASDSPYYAKTKAQALKALAAYPGGLQVGGGITAENAKEFIDAGASHVIVTSYVFADGKIQMDRLCALRDAVGREHIVLDVSCKRFFDPEGSDAYFVMTDRWQKKSHVEVNPALLTKLSDYCDEYLIHAVDVEGKKNGIESNLLRLLSPFSLCPITYAGGVHSYDDIKEIKTAGSDRINVTIGSALSIFGGDLEIDEIVSLCR